MDYFVGLDVSDEKTDVCIIDQKGIIKREKTVSSDPKEIRSVIGRLVKSVNLVGLETGPLSAWLHNGLKAEGLPVTCIEAARMRKYASASPVKTDRSDARVIAQAMRAGLYQSVHIKSDRSFHARILLNHRKALQRRSLDFERVLRGTLKIFGLKIGKISPGKFRARVLELVEGDQTLRDYALPVLNARDALRSELSTLNGFVEKLAREDPVAQLLMTVPGVGEGTAVAFIATIDDPDRFPNSRAVAAHLGLTPRLHESGEVSKRGRITRHGDRFLRTQLYWAAMHHLLKFKGHSRLQNWGMKLAERRGKKRAITAMARKLAVIMLRMWKDGTPFDAQAEAATGE